MNDNFLDKKALKTPVYRGFACFLRLGAQKRRN
jgi:hypothetical protein